MCTVSTFVPTAFSVSRGGVVDSSECTILADVSRFARRSVGSQTPPRYERRRREVAAADRWSRSPPRYGESLLYVVVLTTPVDQQIGLPVGEQAREYIQQEERPDEWLDRGNEALLGHGGGSHVWGRDQPAVDLPVDGAGGGLLVLVAPPFAFHLGRGVSGAISCHRWIARRRAAWSRVPRWA